MAPKRLPTRGGGKASSAKDASRADEEATGAGGTGASGAAAHAGDAAAVRVTSPSRRIPGNHSTPLGFLFSVKKKNYFSFVFALTLLLRKLRELHSLKIPIFWVCLTLPKQGISTLASGEARSCLAL